MATYFGTYETLKRKMLSDSKNVPIWASIFAGGISGITTWTVTYPFDYIKTLMQCDSLENPKHKTGTAYLRD